MRPDSEEAKVTMATMYLTGDAKLWWRTKYAERESGHSTINSWDDLKRELKNQFLPENVEFIARRKLRQLRQTGTVRDYVKQFSALMLDIRDMSEKDKLFYFIVVLKPHLGQGRRRPCFIVLTCSLQGEILSCPHRLVPSVGKRLFINIGSAMPRW